MLGILLNHLLKIEVLKEASSFPSLCSRIAFARSEADLGSLRIFLTRSLLTATSVFPNVIFLLLLNIFFILLKLGSYIFKRKTLDHVKGIQEGSVSYWVPPRHSLFSGTFFLTCLSK